MARLAWLTVCTISIFSSTPLIADNQLDRHFNINPGNMINPMQNMFGGSNRDRADYNNYYYYNDAPYYHPQEYPAYPPTYGYPSTTYDQPTAGYDPFRSPAYYPPAPENQQQTVTPNPRHTESTTHQNRSATPSKRSRMAPTYPSIHQEQFRFRPLENQPQIQTDNYPYTPEPTGNTQQTANPSYIGTPSNGAAMYAPQLPATQPPAMNFRPLDKPGYSK
ncbi:MAG: hypothetical protein P8179_15085 [Candidatus Thiodiazotropha sp.]|jgi:hypothetical protein